MVPNTSELLPDPDSPVKAVSRRFGSSTLTSLRLFTRAPCTRIKSWRSAMCAAGDGAAVFLAFFVPLLIVPPSVGRRRLRALYRRGRLDLGPVEPWLRAPLHAVARAARAGPAGALSAPP